MQCYFKYVFYQKTVIDNNSYLTHPGTYPLNVICPCQALDNVSYFIFYTSAQNLLWVLGALCRLCLARIIVTLWYARLYVPVLFVQMSQTHCSQCPLYFTGLLRRQCAVLSSVQNVYWWSTLCWCLSTLFEQCEHSSARNCCGFTQIHSSCIMVHCLVYSIIV